MAPPEVGGYNGDRYVRKAELDAHIIPMKRDLTAIKDSLSDLTSFMVGAEAAKSERNKLEQARRFWIGIAAALLTALVAAASTLLTIVLS